MPGIVGIVEIDLDVRSVVRDALARLGPVGVPVFMPQLPQSIRVERVLCADVALDQLLVVQKLASERKLAGDPGQAAGGAIDSGE